MYSQPKTLRLTWILGACLLLATSAQAANIAWYSFDDGTAGDSSGKGNHGSLVGNPVTETGLIGLALRLDGADDAVRVPNSDTLDGDLISLSTWIFMDELPAADTRLVQKRQGIVGYSLGIGPSGVVRFEVAQDQANRARVVAPFPLVPEVWSLIFATYDGSDLRLHLHGELVASNEAPGLLSSNDADLLIGRRFAGLMDEVKLGNDALSSASVCAEAQKLWHVPSESCNVAFPEVASELGLDDTNRQHFGATFTDIDQDGWIDIYYVNGGSDPNVPPTPSGVCPEVEDPTFEESAVNQLYMNNGDGTFTNDVAADVGLDDFWNAMRHAWGDYDNDGLRDVYSHNFILSSLYRQVVGPDPMVFEDVSDQAGARVCLEKGTGASFVDFDRDGFLDLFLVEYDPARPASEHLTVLLLNNGDGTFTDITSQSGLDEPNNSMGFAVGDYDNDGDMDMFLTNSHDAASRLYRNEGINPQTGVPFFEDVGPEAGVSVIGEPNRGIGAGFGDFNNDGWLDLLYSREADSRIWQNNGDGTFTDITGTNGLDLAVQEYQFWGGNFADLDNDGWLDIVFTNRLFLDAPGPNRVFFANGDGTFREVSELLGMDHPDKEGLGFVPGDADNDGDLDVLLISHTLGTPNLYFRNQERGNNWVQFRLTGTVSNRDAIGARILVQAAIEPGQPPVVMMREITSGTGFFSDFPRIQTFGLGSASQIGNVRIRWPNGTLQELGPVEINQRHDIVEPSE